MTPDEYFFNSTNKMKIIGCIGFSKGKGRRFTFGSTWIIGHEIIFNRKNNKIGIAKANTSVGSLFCWLSNFALA